METGQTPWSKKGERTMRAMVVDDSKAMRTILKRLLTECGYTEIAEAGNGREGLDVMQGPDAPELALVDWNMPEMSGIEFVAAVRANPAWNNVILMMITTETSIDKIQEALATGADEYVMKPFTKEVLLEKLEIIKSTRA
jgi:two-component system chemotaxis response regulator CheY